MEAILLLSFVNQFCEDGPRSLDGLLPVKIALPCPDIAVLSLIS